jgi:outer membrane protein
MTKSSLIFFLLLVQSCFCVGQTKLEQTISLQEVIEQASYHSPSVKNANNRYDTRYWRFKNYKAGLRPSLSLVGSLPDFLKASTPVTQPDGSVEFRKITQNSISSRLALTQVIPQTGTEVWASTSYRRVDNFENENTFYNGAPFLVGFHQPLSAFNIQKWNKKIEPLRFEEAGKERLESGEQTALLAANYFFDVLKIQTNYSLAKVLYQDGQTNLKIADVKKERGLISENDYARIRLAVLDARKNMNQAQLDLKNTLFDLKSYIGYDYETNIKLAIPENIPIVEIDPSLAVELAWQNRKEATTFKRQLLEAERNLDQARKDNGLKTSLNGEYGISNSAESFNGVFQNPENQIVLGVSVSIPLLDWGRSSSKVRLAESNWKLANYDVERSKNDFERKITVEIERFPLLNEQLEIAKETDIVAQNGYRAAKQEFQNGDLSITEHNLALRDRQQAGKGYINALTNYWLAYYNIRVLTLYDFINHKKLTLNETSNF